MMDVQMFVVSVSSSNCKCFTLFSEGLATKKSLSYNSGAKLMKELIMTHSIFTSSFPTKDYIKRQEKNQNWSLCSQNLWLTDAIS